MRHLKSSQKIYRHTIILPIITTLIFPIVIVDLWAEIYHRVCFPLYRRPCLKRSNYIRIDRHKLKYLTFWQKLYCVYCGYANGLLNYLVAIAAETEKYWCGIKHKKDNSFIPPKHHENFAEYNNQKDFERKYKN